MAEFRIRQNGMTVAASCAKGDNEAEILHYAMQYRKDGSCTVERKHVTPGSPKGYWKRHILFEQWPLAESNDG